MSPVSLMILWVIESSVSQCVGIKALAIAQSSIHNLLNHLIRNKRNVTHSLCLQQQTSLCY